MRFETLTDIGLLQGCLLKWRLYKKRIFDSVGIC